MNRRQVTRGREVTTSSASTVEGRMGHQGRRCIAWGGLGPLALGMVAALAAAGLVIIMIGATVVMWAGGMVAVALMNVVVALLAAFVAYGRWRLAPYRDSSRPSVLRRAS